MLVTSPKALLLDEPLGDLDRLLQLRMRVELRNLQRQLGLMFIHVTHNQEESLSMADRIVVMHDGRIQQVADPLTISTRPENELVASFMGDNNIIRGTVASREGDRLVVDDGHVKASVRAPGSELQVGSAASLAVRAAAVGSTTTARRRTARSTARRPEIVFVEYLGDLVKLHLTLAASGCSPRWPATASRSCAGARARRSASPGTSRMSSSSGPDDRTTPRLDVAEIEQVEGLVEQAPAERALGSEAAARAADAA